MPPSPNASAVPQPSALPPAIAALAPQANGAGASRPALRDTDSADALPVARRRRRSASLLPPLPSPADLADDAPGRVEIITISAPPDVTPAAVERSTATTPALMDRRPIATLSPADPVSTATPADPARQQAATALAAWVPVAALGVALVVIFIVGMVVTH